MPEIPIPCSPEHRSAVELQDARDQRRRKAAKANGRHRYLDGATRIELEQRVRDAELALEGWDAERLKAAEADA